jgi:catechol 2,3-dioxygenase-like lactoylglutathione lyase family enzyme
MKRFHVHISVDSIEESAKFYSALFGQAASVQKNDYAKWMLDDPRINFAISQRGVKTGLDHLGLQLESQDELHAMTAKLHSAGLAVADVGETTCCYAKSDKGWVHDPQGIAWESFVTMGEATTYGAEPSLDIVAAPAAACCAPVAKPKISLKDIAVRPAAQCGVSADGAAGAAGAKACC